MGQPPKGLEPARSALHFFGAEVRRLRQQLGLSQAELGKLLFQHKDLVRKVEVATRMPTRDFVERCDEVLGAKGTLRQMWPMLERERVLRLSRDSTVAARTSPFRPEAMDRPVLDWLLATSRSVRRVRKDEAFASRAAEALKHLRDVDHEHGAGDTYPQVSEYLERGIDQLSTSAPEVATGFLELAGYEAVDLGADGLAQQHYLRALTVATDAGEQLYGGYLIAVSLAHLALHCGDADQAARLAAASLRGTEHTASPAMRAAFRLVLARAHARRGDEKACAVALLQVDADLSRSHLADEPAWISYFGEADLADEKAHCFFDLGFFELAGREAARAVELLTPNRVRRLAIDTALRASSLARTGEIEQACIVGHEAVEYARRTASFRSAHRISLMMAELQHVADLPAVRDLSEYVRDSLTLKIQNRST